MCPTSYVCESISALNLREVTSGGGRDDGAGRWWKRDVEFREEQHPCTKISAAAESGA